MTKTTQGIHVINTLQQRLERGAKIIQNIGGNYRQTWFKPDGTPLSDLELKIPDLYWGPTTWTGCGPMTY